MQSRLNQTKYSRIDGLIACILAILVFFVAFFGTTNRPAWGDDFAAYYNEGIAIAEGRSEEQHARNFRYHPSPMPAEAEDGSLAYVWGYPLFLSFVYRVVGFDRVTYTSLSAYKLISVISLALCGTVLYFLYRRRVNRVVSVALTLFICTNTLVLKMLGSQYSDIVYLFVSMSAVLFSEVYLTATSKRYVFFVGALLAAAMWYTHEVRLNGKMIVAAIAAAFAIDWMKSHFDRKKLLHAVYPFALFFLLVFVSEQLIFWHPTSNMSDISSVTIGSFLKMLNYYRYTVRDLLASGVVFGLVHDPIPAAVKLIGTAGMVFALIGAAVHIRNRDAFEIAYIGLLAVFFIGASMLPYHQDGRYLVPLLPFVLILICDGIGAICRLIGNAVEKISILTPVRKKILHMTGFSLLCCYIVLTLAMAWRAVDRGTFHYETGYDGPYSAASIEMYRYIQEHVEEDALIITAKPRALYLNTLRETIPFENGHTVEEADYFLRNINSWMQDYVANGTVTEEQLASMTEVYSTDSFVLYRIEK